MSKKLAEGIDALVLDVKVGRGAFMKTKKDATALARTMVGLGKSMGKKTVALLTDMDEPLGRYVGNALEMKETIDVLRGGGPNDVVALTVELGAEMLVLGKAAKDVKAGRERIRAAIADGSGLAKLKEIVTAQHGDASMIDAPSTLPSAKGEIEVVSPKSGFIAGIHAEWVGVASLLLGAGRQKKEDTIDHAVGIELLEKRGAKVKSGQPIARIHYNSDTRLDDSAKLLIASYEFSKTAPKKKPLFLGRIT
jgi:pyrimidine-nucleoside phosphorylase